MPENNSDPELCPECGGKIVEGSFEKICKDCGLVINNFFREYAFIFNDIKNKNSLSKQFGERTDFIGGLGSFIDYEKSKYLKDKNGKLLPSSEQKLFRRLKKNYAQFLRIKNHETEYRIFNILNKVSLHLNLNKNIRNDAAYYYKKIIKNEEKVFNHVSLIAFCIFFAVRREDHNIGITIDEISKAFQNFGHRVNPRLILRDAIRYKHHLNIESIPHKSEDYLLRLVDQVITHKDLPERLKRKGSNWSKKEYKNQILKKCHEVLGKLPLHKRRGKNPFILTGAIIYLGDKLLARETDQKAVLTQKIIAEATNIAEYSIRDHYINLLKPLFIDE